MNFNRRDSLNLNEVLSDPQFVAFLRKWEANREPSAVRALFESTFFIFVILIFFYFSFSSFFFIFLMSRPAFVDDPLTDSESPVIGVPGVSIPKSPDVEDASDDLPNQISAAYEVPQFPIEQIEKKLMLQRHLTAK